MDAGSGGVQTARNTDPCIACGGGDDDGEILLCDECNGAYHMTCMGFKGPLLGDWLCRSCQEKINVLAAIVKDGRFALMYASQELRADKEVVLAAVTQNGDALGYASDEPRADKEVVLAAVARNAGALKFASPELHADRDVVLTAVARNGHALMYASPELRADRDVVLAAVALSRDALGYASRMLRADKEVVLAAVAQDGTALEYASDELRADKEVMLAAVAENGDALVHAPPELRADKEVVLAAVTCLGNALADASLELRADKEVVLAAVTQNVSAWHYVKDKFALCNDPLIAAARVATSEKAIALLARFRSRCPATEEELGAIDTAVAHIVATFPDDESVQAAAFEASAALHAPICPRTGKRSTVHNRDRAAFDGELKKVKKKRVAQRNPTHRIICSGGDDEGLVLLCDQCDNPHHAHCVGFEGTLQGDWLCPSCE